MNRDDIIRMAREANLPSCHTTHPKALERFAALVAAHERQWVGLEKEDMPDGENPMFDHEYFLAGMAYASRRLEEKNT